MNLTDLPSLNAALNSLASIFLLMGFLAIKKGRKVLHIRLMVSAVLVSALFLISYLYYHFNAVGMTLYQGTGFLRGLYLIILFTHIPMAVINVPLIILAVVWGFGEKYEKHKRIVKWLWPMWMYVSVTGVVIYLMLYKLPHQI